MIDAADEIVAFSVADGFVPVSLEVAVAFLVPSPAVVDAITRLAEVLLDAAEEAHS